MSSEKITPFYLHQTWKTNQIPTKLKPLSQSCRDKNPELQYILWTDNDLRDLIKNQLPQYIASFDKFEYNIERVDFARYAIMYLYGGVYADLDMQCVRSFKRLIAKNQPIFGDEPKEHRDVIYDGRQHVICNALMISPPSLPIWKSIMDFIIANYVPGRNPVYNTGPMALTDAYEKNPNIFDGALITNPCVFYSQTDGYNPMNSQFHVNTGPVSSISQECILDEAIAIHRWAHTWTSTWDEAQRLKTLQTANANVNALGDKIMITIADRGHRKDRLMQIFLIISCLIVAIFLIFCGLNLRQPTENVVYIG